MIVNGTVTKTARIDAYHLKQFVCHRRYFYKNSAKIVNSFGIIATFAQ